MTKRKNVNNSNSFVKQEEFIQDDYILDDDPSIVLPRDTSGSYLHLKLKRYKSINDLSMNYAKQTWKNIPHNAEVEESCPSSRSKCRLCHTTIEKGNTRFRLWLQCHKGCKISAYFHKNCIYNYPETNKLNSVTEFIGYDKLSTKLQDEIEHEFSQMKKKSQGAKKGGTITIEKEKKNDCDDADGGNIGPRSGSQGRKTRKITNTTKC